MRQLGRTYYGVGLQDALGRCLTRTRRDVSRHKLPSEVELGDDREGLETVMKAQSSGFHSCHYNASGMLPHRTSGCRPETLRRASKP